MIGEKRRKRLERAICNLVDARLKGEELYVSCIQKDSTIIGIRVRWGEKPEQVARWKSKKYKPARVIDYEEALRLIHKHIGYGEK